MRVHVIPSEDHETAEARVRWSDVVIRDFRLSEVNTNRLQTFGILSGKMDSKHLVAAYAHPLVGELRVDNQAGIPPYIDEGDVKLGWRARLVAFALWLLRKI